MQIERSGVHVSQFKCYPTPHFTPPPPSSELVNTSLALRFWSFFIHSRIIFRAPHMLESLFFSPGDPKCLLHPLFEKKQHWLNRTWGQKALKVFSPKCRSEMLHLLCRHSAVQSVLRGAVWFQTISTSLPDIKRLALWLSSGRLCLYVSTPEGLQGGRAPPLPPSHPYASVKIMRQHDDPLQGKRDMTGGASSWSGLSLKAPCDFYF